VGMWETVHGFGAMWEKGWKMVFIFQRFSHQAERAVFPISTDWGSLG
jgi:hypothetical protein